MSEALAMRWIHGSGRKPQEVRTAAGSPSEVLALGRHAQVPYCGGRFEAVNGRYSVCGTRRKSGRSGCANPLAFRVEVLDDTVLRRLEGEVLHPAFIEQVLNLAVWLGPIEPMGWASVNDWPRTTAPTRTACRCPSRMSASPRGLANGICALKMVAGGGFEPPTFGL